MCVSYWVSNCPISLDIGLVLCIWLDLQLDLCKYTAQTHPISSDIGQLPPLLLPLTAYVCSGVRVSCLSRCLHFSGGFTDVIFTILNCDSTTLKTEGFMCAKYFLALQLGKSYQPQKIFFLPPPCVPDVLHSSLSPAEL